jgi:hypothetical protein
LHNRQDDPSSALRYLKETYRLRRELARIAFGDPPLLLEMVEAELKLADWHLDQPGDYHAAAAHDFVRRAATGFRNYAELVPPTTRTRNATIIREALQAEQSRARRRMDYSPH